MRYMFCARVFKRLSRWPSPALPERACRAAVPQYFRSMSPDSTNAYPFVHPQRTTTHEHIKSLGFTYTFIDVGVWMQAFLPLPPRSATFSGMKTMLRI